MFSATTVATSLADLVINAKIAVFTVIVDPRFSPNLVCGCLEARRDTFRRFLKLHFLFSNASKIM